MIEITIASFFIIGLFLFVMDYLNAKNRFSDDNDDKELFLKVKLLRIVLLLGGGLVFILIVVLNS